MISKISSSVFFSQILLLLLHNYNILTKTLTTITMILTHSFPPPFVFWISQAWSSRQCHPIYLNLFSFVLNITKCLIWLPNLIKAKPVSWSSVPNLEQVKFLYPCLTQSNQIHVKARQLIYTSWWSNQWSRVAHFCTKHWMALSIMLLTILQWPCHSHKIHT